jgi:simple sugar transport system ATP-binding protein
MALPYLRLENISRLYGELMANRNVSLEIVPGKILALLGENGAGKSTLMSIMAGEIQPTSGTMLLHGKPAVFSSPEKALQAGIGMVYQHCKLVESLTVAENVFLGQKGGFWLRAKTMQKEVRALAARYGFTINASALVSDLSLGEKQQVEILKLLRRDSTILLFDEPTAVLTDTEADSLFSAMRIMAKEGKSIVFISHKLKEVMAVSDTIAILRCGEVVDHIATSDVTSTTELAERMVGQDVVLKVDRKPLVPRQIVLKIENLHEGQLASIDLELRKGEILGLIGVAGNGQKPLVEVVCGLRKPPVGAVKILGQEWRTFFSSKSWGQALSYIPEDRQRLATCQGLDILDNFLLTTRDEFAQGPWLQKDKARAKVSELLKTFNIRTPDLDVLASQLSGGNQQKLVLAREFFRKPRIIIAEQPTQGLDIRAAEEVRNLLLEAREQAGILLVTGDYTEALALSDRIAVMFSGRIVDCFSREDEDKVAAIPQMMAGLVS